MADDTALLDYGFDIVPVIDVTVRDRLDYPIVRCGRAVSLIKFCSAISSAATDDENCCDPTDFSIHSFAFSLTR